MAVRASKRLKYWWSCESGDEWEFMRLRFYRTRTALCAPPLAHGGAAQPCIRSSLAADAWVAALYIAPVIAPETSFSFASPVCTFFLLPLFI